MCKSWLSLSWYNKTTLNLSPKIAQIAFLVIRIKKSFLKSARADCSGTLENDFFVPKVIYVQNSALDKRVDFNMSFWKHNEQGSAGLSLHNDEDPKTVEETWATEQ